MAKKILQTIVKYLTKPFLWTSFCSLLAYLGINLSEEAKNSIQNYGIIIFDIIKTIIGG